MNKYIPVIGLEVHVELKTKSKMFCGCSAEHFGVEPNTHTCPVCLGLPGALPVPNKKAIEWCVKIGMALNCETPLFSKFDRKNYFYPDLAKGYQISQYDEPFCLNGHVILGSGATPGSIRQAQDKSDSGQARMTKKIRIRRVHMEEDTAKLVHQFGNQKSKIKNQNDEGYSLIDFNRSGVPLVEIVTEPDFSSASEVVEYLKKLQQIVRYLGVSDADMEKGQMRLEPNISLNPLILGSGATPGSDSGQARITRELPKYKVEVKNINSFRFVDKAIEYEIKRQSEILDSGKTPNQETRGWNEEKNLTVSQRSKEEAHDYRYFPEPDIPPIRWEKSQISNLKSQMPEMPDEKLERFKKDYQLKEYDAEIITREKLLADYFEEAVRAYSVILGRNEVTTPESDSGRAPLARMTKQIANWIINKKVDIEQTLPAELIKMIVQSSQKTMIDDGELEKIIAEVLAENQKAVEDYKNGKENVIMFLVGMVMRKSKEKLDAQVVKEKIKAKVKD